jgi:hypothetical protein
MAAFGTYSLFGPLCREPTLQVVEELVGEHPLIRSIRAKIYAYSCQSPQHFAHQIAADIDSDSLPPETPIGLTKGLKLKVIFGNYHVHESRNCRPLFRKNKLTKVVQVREKNRWITLTAFLAMHFPPVQDCVSDGTMREWWDNNGKTFDWTGLPKELKLKIVQFCIPNPKMFIPSYLTKKYKKGYHSRSAPYEIAYQLGDWKALLHVSAEVRVVALRVILVHNDHCPGGLTINSYRLNQLRNTMDRLGKFYQMTGPNSVPVNAEEQRLARQYLNWPKVYPELSRFATLRHGIRKLQLKFNYLETLHFFKVTVGNLHEYRGDKVLTCDVFQKLPNLNNVDILLPKEWWQDEATQIGPQLFHESKPCVRTLHHFIYERAAMELAPYKDFSIRGFMDEDEVQRFKDLHESAMLRLRYEDFSDDESDGGIQLHSDEDPDSAASNISSPQSTSYYNLSFPKSHDDTFPPICECEIPCKDFLDNLIPRKYGYRAGKGSFQGSTRVVWT